jgi:hypothetical protein
MLDVQNFEIPLRLIRRLEAATFMECGRVSYRFSSGTHSLPVFVERRNEFRLRKS